MRPGRIDLGIALAGGALGAAAAWGSSGAAVASGAVMGAGLGLGRWAPRAAWLVAAAVFLVTGLVGVTPGGDSGAPYLLLLGYGFIAGRYETRRSGVVGLVVIVASSVTWAVLVGDAPVPSLFIPVSAWGAGRALRERSLVAAELAARARELDAERDAYAALSVRYERARIASELHDIVAHAISVMVVQASAGQRLVGHDPAATEEAFEAISEAAHQAESEMGRLVNLLADERTSGPGPDLALVEELVSRAAGSGLGVTLTLEGDREGLPPEVTQLAYRVVQEGLTNALRYAAGATVAVRVCGEAGALVVEVENGPAEDEAALAGAGTGNGLRGLGERAEALGGTLEAGPDGAGGWRLAALLPRAAGRRGPDPGVTAPRDAPVSPGRGYPTRDGR